MSIRMELDSIQLETYISNMPRRNIFLIFNFYFIIFTISLMHFCKLNRHNFLSCLIWMQRVFYKIMPWILPWNEFTKFFLFYYLLVPAGLTVLLGVPWIRAKNIKNDFNARSSCVRGLIFNPMFMFNPLIMEQLLKSSSVLYKQRLFSKIWYFECEKLRAVDYLVYV